MADAAKDFASISLLQLEDDKGNFLDIEDAKSLDYEMTKDRKVVQTMNKRRRGRGYQSANIAVTGTIEVPMRRGRPEYDWESAFLNDFVIQMYVERDDGGQRFIIEDMMIGSISNTTNTDGEAMQRIQFVALSVIKDATQIFDNVA